MRITRSEVVVARSFSSSYQRKVAPRTTEESSELAKRAIQASGMSRRAFAVYMGVSHATVNRWCSTKQMIPMHVTPEIAAMAGKA